MQIFFNSGFFNVGMMDILGQIIDCGGVCTVHCRNFGSSLTCTEPSMCDSQKIPAHVQCIQGEDHPQSEP